MSSRKESWHCAEYLRDGCVVDWLSETNLMHLHYLVVWDFLRWSWFYFILCDFSKLWKDWSLVWITKLGYYSKLRKYCSICYILTISTKLSHPICFGSSAIFCGEGICFCFVFFFRHRVQIDSGAHSASYTMGTGDSSSAGKAVGA
jgi:hypothetical protein